MPLVTAASVFASARTYLNDASAAVYTDAVLLPYLKEAYEHGRNEQALKGLPNAYKTSVQVVTIGAVVFPTVSDLLVPIKMEERANGSSDLYDPMTETTWDPNATQTTSLNFWDWRNQTINFLGATTDRQVRLYYMGDMDPTGLTTGSVNLLGNVRSFLGAKVAAFAHEFIQQNTTLAQAANQIAEEQLKKIIAIQIKNRQALPIRMRGFEAYPRYWGTSRSS